MRRLPLGQSGLSVPALCLGTMTWGNQTAEDDAHAQIALAHDHGLDFIDTAEMYPVNPVRAEAVGRTEEIIGRWLARNRGRGDWIIATKVAGEGSVARGGEPITGASIRRALEGSLRRLGTDYVDLYQFHWPNRGSYQFRQNWDFDPSGQDRGAILANMAECVETLAALQRDGKIRHFGLSNESAWGMAQWLALAEAGGGPRPVSVQNEYSLLCRFYDTDMAELSHNEAVTLLAFSTLAAGLLTGKYAHDATPPLSRRVNNPTLGGRMTPQVGPAVAAYVDIARQAGIDPAQMAIAWTMTRPFPVVPILGATTRAQLAVALGAADLRLTPEVLAAIGAAHRAHAMPY